MAVTTGTTGGRTSGVYDPYTQGSGGYGYNGQQYPTMEAAQQAQNPEPGSRQATSTAQQAVLGLQQSQGGAPAASTYASGAPIPQASQGGGFAAPGGGVFTQAGAGSNYSVDTQGNTSYNVTPNLIPQQAAAESGLMGQQAGYGSAAAQKANEYAMQQEAQKAALSQEAFRNKFGLISGIAGSQGGPPLPRESMGGGGGQMSAAETAARNAAFARAKDQAGLIGNSAMQGLTDAMGARGIHGSTIEQEGIGNVLAGAAGGMGEFNREQLLADLSRSGEVADRTYQGNITQRGQDIQQQQQKQSALIALMNAGGGLY